MKFGRRSKSKASQESPRPTQGRNELGQFTQVEPVVVLDSPPDDGMTVLPSASDLRQRAARRGISCAGWSDDEVILTVPGLLALDAVGGEPEVGLPPLPDDAGPEDRVRYAAELVAQGVSPAQAAVQAVR